MGTVVSADGTRIAFEPTGSGPALVIVAGALGYKDFPYLRKLAAEFAKDFSVYSYDRRGRGDSTDTQPFNVQKEIDDLAAVCREAGNPVVVGISSGAALALEAAAAGVPMSRLVAFEPPYMVSDHRRPDHARFEAELTALISRGDRDGALKLFMRTVGVPGFFLAIMRIMPMWKALRRVAHTLPYDAAAMNGFQIPEGRFARIRVPTLLAGGGKSPGSLTAGARAAAAAVPGAQFIEIPRQSHMINAGALARVVREHDLKATG